MPWFYYLEQHVTKSFHVIYTPFDDKIPFIEYFVVPYYLWFPFVVVPVLYFFFKDRDEFYKTVKFMIIGMTIFLIFSTIYPNGQMLRPSTFERDNIFVDMVKQLYKVDTPTNIFPSIHVYNSLGVHIAIMKCRKLADRKWIQRGSFVLAVSIILSTMFLKQHSVFDVLTAFIMGFVMYGLVYRYDVVFTFKQALKEKKKSTPQLG